MAEANPKSDPNDGGDGDGDQSNKKNTNSATAGSSGSKEVEVEEKRKKGDVAEVNIYNLDILHEIHDYKNWKGVDPSDNPDDLREFCTPYINLEIGNARGWIRKFRELKTKFNDDSAPTDDLDKQEFEYWKKIWGNQPKRDDDPGVGSSK